MWKKKKTEMATSIPEQLEFKSDLLVQTRLAWLDKTHTEDIKVTN